MRARRRSPARSNALRAGVATVAATRARDSRRRRRASSQCDGDRFRMTMPERRVRAEARAPRAGESVELRAPIVLRHTPFAADPAAALQAVERGIERPFLEQQERRRGALDPLTDAVAVHRAP